MQATITIHRPDDPRCDADGDVEIWVEGNVGHIEAPSRHCPGDPGSIDVQQGPFEIVGTSHCICTALSDGEEDDAEYAIREAVYSELRGTARGRRILGTLG